MTRHYYAIQHHYGRAVDSDGHWIADELAAFPTPALRDSWVEAARTPFYSQPGARDALRSNDRTLLRKLALTGIADAPAPDAVQFYRAPMHVSRITGLVHWGDWDSALGAHNIVGADNVGCHDCLVEREHQYGGRTDADD